MSISVLIVVIFSAIILTSGYIFFEYIKLKIEIKTKSNNTDGNFEIDKIKELKLIANTKKVPDINQRGELFKKSYERRFLNKFDSNNFTEQKESLNQATENAQEIKDLKTNKDISYNNTDAEYLDALFSINKNIYSNENI